MGPSGGSARGNAGAGTIGPAIDRMPPQVRDKFQAEAMAIADSNQPSMNTAMFGALPGLAVALGQNAKAGEETAAEVGALADSLSVPDGAYSEDGTAYARAYGSERLANSPLGALGLGDDQANLGPVTNQQDSSGNGGSGRRTGGPQTSSGLDSVLDSGSGDSSGGLFGGLLDWINENQGGNQDGVPSASTIDPEWAKNNPRKAQARLIEEQQRLFDNKFKQYEDDAIGRVNDDTLASTRAQEAQDRARRVFKNEDGDSRGVARTQRQLSRYGRTTSPGLEEALNRSSSLSAASAVAGAGNRERDRVQDQQTAWASDLLNTGQGLNQSATSALGSSSSMAYERNRIGEQRDAQQTQNLISTGATIAALAGV